MLIQNKLLTAILFLTVYGAACQKTSVNHEPVTAQSTGNSAARSAARSLSNVPTQDLMPEKGSEEKTFSLTVQDGKEITASVYESPKKSGAKMIVFDPLIAGTDGNLHIAALNSLQNLHGKDRGLFELADAKSEFDSDLDGNAVCWNVSNPKQKFCVLPIKNSAQGDILSLHVWLK